MNCFGDNLCTTARLYIGTMAMHSYGWVGYVIISSKIDRPHLYSLFLNKGMDVGVIINELFCDTNYWKRFMNYTTCAWFGTKMNTSHCFIYVL